MSEAFAPFGFAVFSAGSFAVLLDGLVLESLRDATAFFGFADALLDLDFLAAMWVLLLGALFSDDGLRHLSPHLLQSGASVRLSAQYARAYLETMARVCRKA